MLILAGQEIRQFPVKKPLEIIDTNGAGDSFVGGMFNQRNVIVATKLV